MQEELLLFGPLRAASAVCARPFDCESCSFIALETALSDTVSIASGYHSKFAKLAALYAYINVFISILFHLMPAGNGSVLALT
jgi:hypothetical protein